jgi:alcohol dehydrogenase YqhD (iron-dependent ADH family)
MYMRNFIYQNTTKIYFGKGAIENLKGELQNYGKTVMLAYGRDSIKKNGIYQTVTDILRAAGKTVVEFSGIMPNPTLKKTREGIEIAKKNGVDLILAVGGGSVMDCCKGVAIGVKEPDFWNKYWLNYHPVTETPLPLATVVTMSGTGSEMDGGGVITDEETKIKMGRVYSEFNPKFSIVDPEYTYTVGRYQMVAGVYDAFNHIMETYFSEDDEDNVSDDISEAFMKSLIRNVRAALKDERDYTARSNISWVACLALSGIIDPGKNGDWEIHNIEHQIGAYTDCTHGMGLAAVTVAYYKHIYKKGIQKFARFAQNVWGISADGKSENELALAGIDALGAFIQEIGAASSLRELGLKDQSLLPAIAQSCFCADSGYKQLTHAEILEILKESW